MPTPEAQIGPLLRLGSALDALFETTNAVEGSLDIEDRVTIYARARALGILAIEYMTEEQAVTIQRILHPDFFDPEKEIKSSVSARASLGVLRGYVRGCVNELQADAQMAANAKAYAEEKLKDERGLGFIPR